MDVVVHQSNLTKRAHEIIVQLRGLTRTMPEPLSGTLAKKWDHDPFIILISCLLSLRSRDIVTAKVCDVLFSHATTPQALLALPEVTLEKIIHPIGFYKRKAHILRSVSRELITRFNGKVPSTQKELLSIKGIGRKTANLVLGQAFGIPALCVDTHVHRLANNFGLVSTKTPEQTEKALAAIVPQRDWIEFNTILVKWGQNVCTPGSRHKRCAPYGLCKKKELR